MKLPSKDVHKIHERLSGNTREFFKRVWNDGDLSKYAKRLESIGFTGHENVLDAGFGVGQWLYCLSQLNQKVEGIEYAQDRCDAVASILNQCSVDNVGIQQGSIENLPYQSNSFDCIFCYGVMFITDFKQSMREFFRVLKPGGKLYVTANGLGWYLHLLIDERNKSENYDPRKLAAQSLANTFGYLRSSNDKEPGQLVLPSSTLVHESESIGFKLLSNMSEGCTNNAGSFYEFESYMGEEFVYELILEKAL